MALRFADSNPADGVLVLLVAPVSICAVVYGVRGGLVSGVVAISLMLVWGTTEGHPLGLVGYLTRAGAFLAVGFVVGRFADERRRLTDEAALHHDLGLDLFAVADLSGFFRRVNPAWKRTLGYDEQELLSRPFISFVHPDDVEATLERASALTQDDTEVIGFQNRYLAADDSYRWLEWTSKNHGDLIYAAARDITDKKLAEEALADYSQRLELEVRERTRELEDARLETLRRLALAGEFRDADTREHTERVGRLAERLARELDCDERTVKLIRQAAPLHDLGKVGVSDTILLKPGRLDPSERRLMQRHVEMGAAILAGSSSAVLRMAEEIILPHHEWWDGNGYPNGLCGAAIPLSGRIVALVDVFDALTHDRPYKKAWPLEQALAEIRSLSGRQFDPRVVDAFENVQHQELRVA